MSIGGACGLQELDGSLWGVGSDFKAEFRSDAVEFTPALGAGAPHNLPVAVTLAAVGRGGDLSPVEHVPVEHSGLQVRYRHAACLERYEVSPAGIAQSFVFDVLPPGEGDLVLRLALATELPLVAAGADGLRFALPGLGGVSIGGVTAIDARGRRGAGTIRCDAGCVELRVPADLLAGASLPLVVDPLVQTFSLPNVLADFHSPDVASSGNTIGGLLVAFEVQFSATDRDIRARNVDESGTVGSTLLVVTSGSALDTSPAVGAVTQRSCFIVVYERGGDLLARSVTFPFLGVPSTVSAEYTVASGNDVLQAPDVGSELTTVDDDALCVYYNATADAVQARQITCGSTGALSAFGTVTLGTAPVNVSFGRPRIAHDGGEVGRYLITYPRSSLIGLTTPQGVIVDRNLNVLASGPLSSTGNDEDGADVDGDGKDWVVAFSSEPPLSAGDQDIRAMAVHFDGGSSQMVLGPQVGISSIANIDEFEPAVALVGGSCLVAWRRRVSVGSTDTDVYAKTVDLYTCAVCESTVALGSTTSIEQRLTAACNRDDDDNAVVLWERTAIASGTGNIDGAVFRSDGGHVMSAQPGCGLGGEAAMSCAHVGNANFRVRLRSALPGAAAWLVVSPAPAAFACGPCTLRADPFHGFLFGGFVADAIGNADQPIPIPNDQALAQLNMTAQWIVGHPAGLCSYLVTDFSSSIRFVIE